MPSVHAQPPHQMLSNRFLSSVGGLEQRLVLLILNYRLPPVTFALWKHGKNDLLICSHFTRQDRAESTAVSL